MNGKMRKMMYGALALCTLALGGCSDDLKKDLDQVKQEVAALKGRLDALERDVKGGLSIKKVESIENGIRITLADGKVHDITSGAPGTVWSISEDGFWVKEGVKTDMPARGPQGQDGRNGRDGLKYYPNPETGTWWVYDSEVDVDEKGKDIGISFTAGGSSEDAGKAERV